MSVQEQFAEVAGRNRLPVLAAHLALAPECTQPGAKAAVPTLLRDSLKRTLDLVIAASALALKTVRLPSGAGHDAQMMAKLGPMGMIFVPSIGGISHSPRELTRWSDCANGANVLLQTVLRMDSL